MRGPTPNRQQGFTYLGALLAVAISTAALGSTATSLYNSLQRQKEGELLHVGREFRRAIALYYHSTPGPRKRYPMSLDQLLNDSRYPKTRRYLRKIYHDPVSGKREWGLVLDADGAITGVYSLSERKPLKQQGFADQEVSFNGAVQYRNWQFIYQPGLTSAAR